MNCTEGEPRIEEENCKLNKRVDLLPAEIAQRFIAAEDVSYDFQMITSTNFFKVISNYGEVQLKNGISYSGNFMSGFFHGFGDLTLPDQSCYSGEFVYGKLSGKGKFSWPNGRKYTGNFFDNKRHGEGEFIDPTTGVEYNGEFTNDIITGYGTLINHKDKSVYTGEFKEGLKHGQGKLVYANSDCFEGNFHNGMKKGKGVMMWNSVNQSYEGEFSNDIINGLGLYSYLSEPGRPKNFYAGYFENGQRSGKGIYIYKNGNKFVGYWRNNLKQGLGELVWADSKRKIGLFDADREVKIIRLIGNDTKSLNNFFLHGESQERLEEMRNVLARSHSLLTEFYVYKTDGLGMTLHAFSDFLDRFKLFPHGFDWNSMLFLLYYLPCKFSYPVFSKELLEEYLQWLENSLSDKVPVSLYKSDLQIYISFDEARWEHFRQYMRLNMQDFTNLLLYVVKLSAEELNMDFIGHLKQTLEMHLPQMKNKTKRPKDVLKEEFNLLEHIKTRSSEISSKIKRIYLQFESYWRKFSSEPPACASKPDLLILYVFFSRAGLMEHKEQTEFFLKFSEQKINPYGSVLKKFMEGKEVNKFLHYFSHVEVSYEVFKDMLLILLCLKDNLKVKTPYFFHNILQKLTVLYSVIKVFVSEQRIVASVRNARINSAKVIEQLRLPSPPKSVLEIDKNVDEKIEISHHAEIQIMKLNDINCYEQTPRNVSKLL